jgi:hypothetical protein
MWHYESNEFSIGQKFMKERYRILVGKSVENYHLEHRDGNGRITLKYNLGRYYENMK